MRKIHLYIGNDVTACGKNITVNTVIILTSCSGNTTCGNCLRSVKPVLFRKTVDPGQLQLFPEYK